MVTALVLCCTVLYTPGGAYAILGNKYVTHIYILLFIGGGASGGYLTLPHLTLRYALAVHKFLSTATKLHLSSFSRRGGRVGSRVAYPRPCGR